MKKRLLIITLILTLAITALSSCGAGAKAEERDNMFITSDMSAAETYAPEAEYGYNGSYAPSKGVYDSVEIESPTTGANNGDYSEKIIKTVSISSQTKEYEKSLDGILAAVKQFGGYEESVSSSGKGYYSGDYYTRTARMTLRIPTENLESLLGEVGGLINVTNQSTSISNVTSQYYDTKARLSVLETERQAYEEMLGMAKEVYEVLEIKDRLYKTIEEIEASKTQLNVLDNKVSFSTVHITVEEVKEYVAISTPRTSFGERIKDAFKDSWIGFANGFQNFVVWFIASIPTLLVLAVIIGGGITLGIIIFKKARRRNS